MTKAVVFDFDGVLFDSVDVKTRAFQRLFAAEAPDLQKEIVDYHIANGGISRFEKFRSIYSNILKRPLPEAEFARLCADFAKLVVDEVVASPWVPGAREFLDAHAGNYLCFIVSATPDPEIKEIVRRKNIGHHFKDVFGSPQKKGDLLKNILKAYNLAGQDVVYIGDAPNDWESAKQAGVRFLWRPVNAEFPALDDYQGPRLTSLIGLDDLLIHSSVLWIAPSSMARQAIARLGGRPFRWSYLGTDVFQRKALESLFSREAYSSISEHLDRMAHELKRPFLDWMVQLGARQVNVLGWWCSAIASKSPLQTDFFLLVCYAEWVAASLARPRTRDEICVIEDPWLFELLKENFSAEPNLRFIGSTRLTLFWKKWRARARGFAVRGYFVIDLMARYAITALTFPESKSDPQPSTLIFNWVEEHSFEPHGRFRDMYTGRLDAILAQRGETVRRLTFAYFPWKLFKKLRERAELFILSPRYIRLSDIGLARKFFRLNVTDRLSRFRNRSYAVLLAREMARENSQMQFLRFQLWYRLSRRIAQDVKSSVKAVIYPFENQPWEKVFCMAWKQTAPSVALVGYQHSSVGELLLNYFLGQNETPSCPLPDRLIANGPLGLDTLKRAGYSPAILENGGALRYEYLHQIQTRPAASGAKKMSKVLVVFPTSAISTVSLLDALLENFSPHQPGLPEFFLKFHPDLPLELAYKAPPSLPPHFKTAREPLSELLGQTRVFIFVPPTTAWWEALLSGLPVIKFRHEFLDIDPIESERVVVCSRSTLKDTLHHMLQEQPAVNLNARETLLNVFSTVREDVWAKVTSRE